jgi:hypothetical protein
VAVKIPLADAPTGATGAVYGPTVTFTAPVGDTLLSAIPALAGLGPSWGLVAMANQTQSDLEYTPDGGTTWRRAILSEGLFYLEGRNWRIRQITAESDVYFTPLRQTPTRVDMAGQPFGQTGSAYGAERVFTAATGITNINAIPAFIGRLPAWFLIEAEPAAGNIFLEYTPNAGTTWRRAWAFPVPPGNAYTAFLDNVSWRLNVPVGPETVRVTPLLAQSGKISIAGPAGATGSSLGTEITYNPGGPGQFLLNAANVPALAGKLPGWFLVQTVSPTITVEYLRAAPATWQVLFTGAVGGGNSSFLFLDGVSILVTATGAGDVRLVPLLQ